MSKIVAAVGGVALVAAGAAIWLQHEDNAALRSEIALLRGEVREAAATQRVTSALPVASVERRDSSSTEPSAASAADFAKLREEIAGLRKNTQSVVEFVQMAQAAAAMKEMSNAQA